MGLVVLIIVLLLLFGGLPYWGYHQMGWGPSGLGAVLVVVCLILLLTGRL